MNRCDGLESLTFKQCDDNSGNQYLDVEEVVNNDKDPHCNSELILSNPSGHSATAFCILGTNLVSFKLFVVGLSNQF